MNEPIRDAVIDSVVAVPTYRGEAYLCRRQPQLLAFPGYHGFPGGKVEAGDREAPPAHPLFEAHPPRFMRALVRQFTDELGFDLLAAAGAGSLRSIRLLGDALTPPHGGRQRLHARFYRLDFEDRPSLGAGAGELAEGRWAPFADWLALDARGGLICVTPTRRILHLLAASAPAQDSPQDLGLPEPEPETLPLFEIVRGLLVLPVPSNTLPPASDTNAFLLGDDTARRVLVDPSPRDAETLQRLRRTVESRGRLDEIFLTHHHPDHREFANVLARDWQLPLGMSATTRALIADRDGQDWFDGVPALRLYEDGEILTEVLGSPLRTLAVPGHDAGHMALMPDSRAWCIVGDLIQGVGTVVVGGKEADMGLYFRSLQRIIDLDPAAIVPSHGTVTGTTYRLQETLRHRQLREQQVLDLHSAGRSVDEMLARMYRGTPAPLLRLARLNIESHLDKLRAEGRVAP